MEIDSDKLVTSFAKIYIIDFSWAFKAKFLAKDFSSLVVPYYYWSKLVELVEKEDLGAI